MKPERGYGVLAPAVIRHLLRDELNAAERPAAWVLLAPPSVATAAAELAYPGGGLSVMLYSIASVTLLGLLWHLRWLTAAGFQPSWACFTFPSAAFVGASWAMAMRTGSPMLEGVAFGSLLIVTLISVRVAALTLRPWTRRCVTLAPVRIKQSDSAIG
ncbi:MAG: SLAC1 family transporter [Roseinatronobacter sp.]